VNSQNSPIFTKNWKIKKELMSSSLSQSSLRSIMKIYESTFVALAKMRRFVNTVDSLSSFNEVHNRSTPSKMYRSYSGALSSIITYVKRNVVEIERDLKKPNEEFKNEEEPCTTLIRLGIRLRPIIKIISVLNSVHEVLIESPSENEDDLIGLQSVRLISILGTCWTLQTEPQGFGTIMFLFSKCFRAFLEELTSTINDLAWKEEESVFRR
jgi:hypothetical protein